MELFFVLLYFLLGIIITLLIHFNIEAILDDKEDLEQYKENNFFFIGFLLLISPIALACMLVVNVIDFIKNSFGGKK
jgi:hypothetical protein